MGYNPSAPSSIGVEWFPATESVTPLTSVTDCVAWKVASSATETITQVYVPHTWSGASTGYGKLLLDVYNLADTGAGSSPTTTRYAPNVTQANNNMFAPSGATWNSVTTTTHTYIDETTPDDTDYVSYAKSSYSRFEFGSAAFTGAVQSVSFQVRAMGYSGGSPRIALSLYYNGSRVSLLGYVSPPADSDDAGPNFPRFQTYTLGPFTTNPRTGVAWTAADITSFDASNGHALHIENYGGLVGVSWLSMVVSSGTDKRVATGSTATQSTLPSGTQTNLPITLAANWSKTTSTNYLLVARRIDDPTGAAQALIPQIIYLGTDTCPHGQGISYSSTIDSSGFVTADGAAVPTKTIPFWLGTSGTAISADSQPYWDLTAKACHTSSTLKQGISAASATAYKPIRVLLGGSPNADLSIRVKKVSDNSAVGGTAVLTAATLADTAITGTITDATWGQVPLRTVTVSLGSAATLATATSYYAEFTSTAGAATPWLVGMLDATASHSLTGNQTYGGTANQATVAGTGVPQGDLVVLVATAPTAPSSITVTKTTTTINGVSIDYAAISWVNGGALSSAFSRWEVERSEDSGTTWVQIATISTEATVTFNDYEGKRATAAKYRVRIVRSDGITSDWTTQSNTVTPAATSSAWAIFTTNSDSAVTVGYTPDGSTTSFDFVSASEVTYIPLHDQDYTAAFRPLEERGIAWNFTLQIHTSQTTPSAGAGVRVFNLLRAAANASGSICLHTADGERFFGSLVVNKGNRDFGANAYMAECSFRQTSADASVVAL